MQGASRQEESGAKISIELTRTQAYGEEPGCEAVSIGPEKRLITHVEILKY